LPSAPAVPLPTDNYNGVTVAYTEKQGGVYQKLSSGNVFDQDAVGVRTSVDLLAPGDVVELATLGGSHVDDSGTSIAAPHVTGTVALLQQFASNHPVDPHWNADARRHEVMKAVLLNSADKIKDDGSFAPIGTFIGMEKTIRDTDNSTWLDTAAYTDVGPGDTKGETPLSLRLGAGQLNANRAKIQYSPGEYHANAAPIPAIGWDFGTTAGDDSINKYAFASQIKGDTFVSLTLAWDRTVAFGIDNGTTGKYDIGDTFVADCCFTNLDLYLMPAGATDLSQALTSSQAADPTTPLSMLFSKFQQLVCMKFGCVNLTFKMETCKVMHSLGGQMP
jgi:subtilisin family serine protease